MHLQIPNLAAWGVDDKIYNYFQHLIAMALNKNNFHIYFSFLLVDERDIDVTISAQCMSFSFCLWLYLIDYHHIMATFQFHNASDS